MIIPGSLDGLCAMYVTQLAETEAISTWRVNITVHRYDGTVRQHLKRLAHLNVHLKVCNRAPVIWSWEKEHSYKSIRTFNT